MSLCQKNSTFSSGQLEKSEKETSEQKLLVSAMIAYY